MTQYMFIAINTAYNSWHSMTKEEVAEQVVKGSITPDEYKRITGEDYEG